MHTANLILLCSKVTAQFHSTKGSIVESIGNMTGATSWQQSGKEEHAAGDAEYNASQAEGYDEGTADHVGGKKDSAVTGDRSQEQHGMSVFRTMCVSKLRCCIGNVRHDKGEAQREVNRSV